MKKKIGYLIAAFLLIVSVGHAQTLLLFTWDNDPNKLVSDIGPDATTASTTSFIGTPGTSAPNGLNPGLNCGFSSTFCRVNINMVVPNTGGIFDVGQVDISIDYRRTSGHSGVFEQDGWLLSRGNSLRLGFQGGKLAFSYAIDVGGSPVYVPGPNPTDYRQCWPCTPTITNADMPNDNAWHNYRFVYDQVTGAASIYIDGILNYTVPWWEWQSGRPLYWNTSDPWQIGNSMDGHGNNDTQLDNASIGTPLPLPVTLNYFDGELKGFQSHLSWETSAESNNSHFTIERSQNGEYFETVGVVQGSGTVNSPSQYTFVDPSPQKGSNIYRLLQTDLDGMTRVLRQVEVNMSFSQTGLVALYPNPLGPEGQLKLKFEANQDAPAQILITDAMGKVFMQETRSIQTGVQNLSLETANLPAGMYLVKVTSMGQTWSDKFLKVN